MNRTCAALVLVGALAVTACTRPEDATDDDTTTVPAAATTDGPVPDTSSTTAPPASTTEPPPTTATPTTAPATTAPATTAPPPTTSAEATTTTVAPTSPTDLVPFFDGVLPYRFGDHDLDVVPGLAAVLGDPVSDGVVEYPDTSEGFFYDPSGEVSFVAPFGRTTCFDAGLCVQFGAGAPETLVLTGWRLEDGASPELVTEQGMAIGDTLAEHADLIEFDPAASCYQVAYGTADGVDVTLLSDDGVFAAPNEDGDGVVLGDPDPERVRIIELRAGRHPQFVFDDC